ncbi:hypothetical protein [Arcticibacterium luteifluviistationis]|uniref:DUF6249 domain-containing protein n=1 Tax=Arcticibacterium luteifluviistationis TaxID=1784714 RepID=A0A2Z4G7Q7_9BACT|nr:hypothetical protein [Arcticibacterium luteifluviistationis]AWV97216.1 hypothetical protein DJ013_03135 [Arcticibacterium luteifluviistationis]
MKSIVPIIAIIMTFGTISFIVAAITNYLLKKKLIQSGNLDAESQKIISQNFSGMKFDNLKWGLVLLFAGVGLVIIDLLPISDIQNMHLPLGIELISIAIGFLTYFFYMKNKA